MIYLVIFCGFFAGLSGAALVDDIFSKRKKRKSLYRRAEWYRGRINQEHTARFFEKEDAA